MAISVTEARSIVRKAKRRAEEPQSQYLNLTAMMDMMTILLVFMIENLSVTTSPVNIGVNLPETKLLTPAPEDATTVTIARNAILVQGVPIVKVENGDVDSGEKKAGAYGILIGKLQKELEVQHDHAYDLTAPGEEPKHELTIVADKDVPYRLLYAVMYTAGASCPQRDPCETDEPNKGSPGYQKFRLITERVVQ
jgi:biopolymer transport protein ExbD